MANRTPRFTRITGMLSGVQQDEVDLEPPDDVPNWFPRFGRRALDAPDPLDPTFDPLSDPLNDPFPEELR